MDKNIKDLLRCNSCAHKNICKWYNPEVTITLPEEYPTLDIKVICKEFKEKEIIPCNLR